MYSADAVYLEGNQQLTNAEEILMANCHKLKQCEAEASCGKLKIC